MTKSIYHRHHILPKHAGGTNDLWNIATLTVAEHAEAHFIRWVLYRNNKDKCAWLLLSGIVPHYHAIQLKHELAHLGNKETSAKISKALTGRKRASFTDIACKHMSEVRIGERNPMYGKKGESNPNYGRHNTDKTKRAMKLARTKVPKSQCPNCGLLCKPHNLKRWHGSNCRKLASSTSANA